jgi:hypothetical protein
MTDFSHRPAKRAMLMRLTGALNAMTRVAAAHPEAVLAAACVAVGLSTAIAVAGVSFVVGWLVGAR